MIPFIIARTWSSAIDITAVFFALRIDIGITVNFAHGSANYGGIIVFGKLEHVLSPNDAYANGFEWIGLVMRGRCGIGHLIEQ
jgi:hypothetical protein